MNWCALPSPLGLLTLSGSEAAITGLWLPEQASRPVIPAGAQNISLFRETARWLESYFFGRPAGPPPPVALTGTPFQLAVWALLQQIPCGQSATYGQLSDILCQQGIPSSPQAVGGAVSRNPISILVPCHRVLGRGGRLTGYAGGLDAKRFLLRLEHIPFRE